MVPTYANAQTSQITLLDTLGEFKRNERIFVFGQVANVLPDLYVVIQIVNPNGDLCQVQQIKPLSDGHFITEPAPLSGSVCGVVGTYLVKVFYGDFQHTSSFSLTSATLQVRSDVEYLAAASLLVEKKIDSITNLSEGQITEFKNRLEQIKTISASQTAISQMGMLYSDLLFASPSDSDTFTLNSKFRPAIQAAF
ncbi:MAG: hypothetical protein QXW91_06625, partial [Candidatus Nitrosotenuis sp.]